MPGHITLGTVGEFWMHGLLLPDGREPWDSSESILIPAAAAAKLVVRMLDTAAVADDDKATVLAISPEVLADYRDGKADPQGEQLSRIEDLLRCHKALRVLLPSDVEQVGGWLKATNRQFQPTPLEFMKQNGTSGVREFLEAELGR